MIAVSVDLKETYIFSTQVIFALNQTILQQESLRAGSLQIPYTTKDLIKHYNCGDLSSIIFSHDSSQVRALIPCSAQGAFKCKNKDVTCRHWDILCTEDRGHERL